MWRWYTRERPTKDAVTVEASAVRTFVDGREIPTRVFNEGVGLPETKDDKADPSASSASAGTMRREAPTTADVWMRSPSGQRRSAMREISACSKREALPYAAAKARAGNAEPIETGWLRTALLSASNAEFAKQRAELDRLRTEWLAVRRSAPLMMVMQEMATPRETHVLLRGAYNAPGDKVEPAVPEALLGSWPADAPKNRLGLAQWLTQPDHPLTVACGGEPLLAAIVRHGHRENQRQLRTAGRVAQPSRTARLAGTRVH